MDSSSSSETPSDTTANSSSGSSGGSKNGSKNGVGGNRDAELEPEGVRTSPMGSNAASTLTSRRDGGRSPSLSPSPSPSPSPSLSLSSSPPGCGCTVVTGDAEEITITLDPTTGGHFDLTVDRTESIENLKKIISKRLKVAKERICLLHRERQLREGTLQENHIQDGSRLTLLPSVETGLLAQRPEQSVMQALESLNDSQVNDFLSGKAPLNLTMRLGDHMMLIQLQLSTVTPAAPAGGSGGGSTSATTTSSSSTTTVNAGGNASSSSSSSLSSSTTQSRRSYVIPAPRTTKTPSKLQGNNAAARTSSLISSLASILQAATNCNSNLSSSTTTTTATTTTATTTMESSATSTCNTAATVASKSTTSPRNSTASPTNLELSPSPIMRTHYCTTDSPASPSPSPPPPSAHSSSPSSATTVGHFPRSAGGSSPLSTSGSSRQSCIVYHHSHHHSHHHHSHHHHSHSHSHSHSHHHSRNKLLSFDPLQPSTSLDPASSSSTSSIPDPVAASQQHSITLGTPQKKKLCTNHHHHQQQQQQQQHEQEQQHQIQQIDLERNARKIDKESGPDNGVTTSSMSSCNSPESPNVNNAIDGGKPTATLDTRALAEASRNLTQTLKQLSSEVLTSRVDLAEENARRRQGAIIESMHHHGKGVYSGTFSGTLNPALQDRHGRPKRDISTIIHILNDLLCATPAAAAGHYRHHHRHSHATNRQQQSTATISSTTTTTTTTTTSGDHGISTTTYTTEELSKENEATKGKMKRLRLVMEQRRAKRKARRQARAAPYTTQWAALTPNPDNTSTSGTTNSNTNTEPQGEPELQPCSPEPVVA